MYDTCVLNEAMEMSCPLTLAAELGLPRADAQPASSRPSSARLDRKQNLDKNSLLVLNALRRRVVTTIFLVIGRRAQ
jgi:hypothetical protein